VAIVCLNKCTGHALRERAREKERERKSERQTCGCVGESGRKGSVHKGGRRKHAAAEVRERRGRGRGDRGDHGQRA